MGELITIVVVAIIYFTASTGSFPRWILFPLALLFGDKERKPKAPVEPSEGAKRVMQRMEETQASSYVGMIFTRLAHADLFPKKDGTTWQRRAYSDIANISTILWLPEADVLEYLKWMKEKE